MRHVVVLAGLPVMAFDRVKRESSKRFAPNGHLVVKPIKGYAGYPRSASAELIAETHAYLATLDETEPVSVLLAYVVYQNESSAALVDTFFPFALARRLDPLDLSGAFDPRERGRVLDEYVESIVRIVVALRRAG